MNTKETIKHYPILAQCLGGVIQQVVYENSNHRANYGWATKERLNIESLPITVAVFHIIKIKTNVSTNL